MTVFDSCLPFPVGTSRIRRAILNDPASGFIGARQVYERAKDLIEVRWSRASEGDVANLEGLYAETFGGILPMDFTHPDGSGTIEVAFTGRPTFEVEKANGSTYVMAAQLEVVL